MGITGCMHMAIHVYVYSFTSAYARQRACAYVYIHIYASKIPGVLVAVQGKETHSQFVPVTKCQWSS